MFLFWGSGTRVKYWDIGGGLFVVCVYRYAHFWYILRWITNKRWYLQSDKRSEDRDLTIDEIEQFKSEYQPKISAYSS